MIITSLEFISLLSVGLVAGATFYSSFVEIPIRAKMTEEKQLTNWKLVFPVASNSLKTYGMITVFTIALTWYFTQNIYWLISIAPLLALLPFTKIYIAGINDKIMALKDSNGAIELIKKWAFLHHVRIVLAVIAFILCILTVTL